MSRVWAELISSAPLLAPSMSFSSGPETWSLTKWSHSPSTAPSHYSIPKKPSSSGHSALGSGRVCSLHILQVSALSYVELTAADCLSAKLSQVLLQLVPKSGRVPCCYKSPPQSCFYCRITQLMILKATRDTSLQKYGALSCGC